MKQLKRFLGLLWIVVALAALVFLIAGAVQNIDAQGKTDISRPLPWIIIIFIFTPIAIGMMIFGWYAWKGEYDRHIE